ncbi:hypothetical protein BC941DRAFT_469460 [Chlamydoabsidia padenii]|nr:hypothetical protein BC941DRAFT_469460 [Chlamydoabsidia padenii]
MDSSSLCTGDSISSLSHSEVMIHSDQDQTLPLTSDNLEILQMTSHIHAKHQYIAAYVKNQIAILALEAKLQHQRWKEMQTLVPLETAPFEKETILCCTETPRIKKRNSWAKQRHYCISSSDSAQQKYHQDKMDLIKQGLCGSSCLSDQPNPLASLLFSSLVSTCSHSSAFSFFDVQKPSKPCSVLSSSSISSLGKPWWKRHWDPKTNKKCHHDHADFLAFRYPKMIPFQKLRDTALQLLLSSDHPNNHDNNSSTSCTSSSIHSDYILPEKSPSHPLH